MSCHDCRLEQIFARVRNALGKQPGWQYDRMFGFIQITDVRDSHELTEALKELHSFKKPPKRIVGRKLK